MTRFVDQDLVGRIVDLVELPRTANREFHIGPIGKHDEHRHRRTKVLQPQHLTQPSGKGFATGNEVLEGSISGDHPKIEIRIGVSRAAGMRPIEGSGDDPRIGLAGGDKPGQDNLVLRRWRSVVRSHAGGPSGAKTTAFCVRRVSMLVRAAAEPQRLCERPAVDRSIVEVRHREQRGGRSSLNREQHRQVQMSSYSIELPARRTAWLADDAYQVRLTEQARTRAAAGNIRPIRLRLEAASMPETYENAELAERDEVRVRFTFRVTEVPVRRSARRLGSRRVVCIAIIEVD